MSKSGWTVCNMCGHQWPSQSDYFHICPSWPSAPVTANAPKWTTTPPTEPGWYWTRYPSIDDDKPYPLYTDGYDKPIDIMQWFSVRIAEPPRGEEP